MMAAKQKLFIELSVRPAKINKVKIFLERCYMIKRVLTFVSGVQKTVLVDFISQIKFKILCKVKTCYNCLTKNFLTKTIKFIFFKFFLNF